MKYVVVYGVPSSTPKETLLDLRRKIVAVVLGKVYPSCKLGAWLRVFLVPDMLDEPVLPVDGSTNIYVWLDEGLMVTEFDTAEALVEITMDLAEVIRDTFEGKYEVDCIVPVIDSKSRVVAWGLNSR